MVAVDEFMRRGAFNKESMEMRSLTQNVAAVAETSDPNKFTQHSDFMGVPNRIARLAFQCQIPQDGVL